jgi:hypothetical protein
MSVENGSNAKLHKFDVSYIRDIYKGQAWGFEKSRPLLPRTSVGNKILRNTAKEK